MLNSIRAASKLSFADWATMLSASYWLLVADRALRRSSLGQVQARLKPRPAACAENTGVRDRRQLAERVCFLVGAAARYHLYPMSCLPRSLVAQRLLLQRGVQAELRIGVRKEDGRVTAHAWLECEGRPLCEVHDVEERFLPLVAGNG